MTTPLSVLLVEDKEDHALLVLRELRRAKFDPKYERVDSEENMRIALEKGGWELVLSDHVLPDFDSLGVLKLLNETGLDVPFIIVSGSIGEDMAAAIMKSGAHDYVLNNNLTRLGSAVERELREAEGRRARTKSDEEQQRLHTELEAAYAQMERRVREITASIMFTDLEGSTAMLTRLGDDENQSLLEIHGEIIRRQVQNHGGLNVKNTGDGYMLAFYSARKAVSCAVEIQKDLQDYNRRNEDRQLKVRIGINVGETIKENDDYFGTAVVMAARIMDTASGGQILVSDLLQQIAYRPTDTEYSYSDFGRRTLKGLDQEAQIFEVKWGR